MSVLTDRVEAQGEKIKDLETSLEEHRQKLASSEDMLQQVVHGRANTHIGLAAVKIYTNACLLNALTLTGYCSSI